MRFALVYLVLSLAALLSAQAGTPGGGLGTSPQTRGRSLFLTTPVDGAIVVSKSRTGADLVEVSILNSSYAQDLLRQQIALLGKELKSEPRGVDIGYARTVASDAGSTVLRGTFAIDGVIDRASGIMHLRAIARAFALANSRDKLNALMIVFQGETPTPNTLRSCGPPQPGCAGAIVEGRNEGRQIGIEYRLKYLTHDPSAIDLPDNPREVPVQKAVLPTPKASTDWTLTMLIIVGAAAAGALVYSLLLGRRRRTSPRSGGPPGGSSGGSGGVSRARRHRFCPHFAPPIV